MNERKPILVLSDLTRNSDPAVQFSGRLAHALGCELQPVHAMDLTLRPLRSAVPALSSLAVTIDAVAETMREQLRRVAPDGVRARAPVVDMDSPARALRIRAAELNPMVVVTPNLWRERVPAGGPQGKLRSLVSGLGYPLLVLREAPHRTHNRVVVVTAAGHVHDETIEAAERWAFWLSCVYNTGMARTPTIDVVALDDNTNVGAIESSVLDAHTDVVTVDRAMFGRSDIAPLLDSVLQSILQHSVAPIAVLGGKTAKTPSDTGPIRNTTPATAA